MGRTVGRGLGTAGHVGRGRCPPIPLGPRGLAPAAAIGAGCGLVAVGALPTALVRGYPPELEDPPEPEDPPEEPPASPQITSSSVWPSHVRHGSPTSTVQSGVATRLVHA
jgi:hypothetical protein